MNYKNKLNQIKALLALEVKLAQMKLEDGVTIVEAESFEPDYSIGIVTADGIVPMPVGEYKMEDGSILVVEVEGIIAEIKQEEAEAEVEVEVEAAPEEVVEPMMEAELPASAPTPKKVVESVSKETFFEAQIEALRNELAEIKAENEALKLSKQTLEVELSNVEEGAEAIVPNPEAESKTSSFKLSKNRTRSIEDSVYSKIFNK
jgi:regulator of replication initiation timing